MSAGRRSGTAWSPSSTTALLAYYPYIRDNSATFQKLLQTYPRSLLDAFGISDLTSFAGFLGGEVFNVIWPVLMAAFAITAGSAVVAAEVEQGTADLWLSAPAARAFQLGGKLVALGLARGPGRRQPRPRRARGGRRRRT